MYVNAVHVASSVSITAHDTPRPALLDASLHGLALTTVGDDGTTGARLPFSWTGVTLYATGASALRVRLTPAASGAVSLTLADASGEPVATVESLVLRALAAGDLDAASGTGDDDSLFRVDWTVVSAPTPTTSGPYAVLGTDELGLRAALAATGATVTAYADVAALAAAVRDGATLPESVFVTRVGDTHDGDTAGSVRASLYGTLGVVGEWLAFEDGADARLVVVTSGAVGVGSGDVVSGAGLADAPVWGLVRSAQSENPGRLALVDVDGAEQALALLPAVLGLDEPQVAVRGDVVWVPRLVRAGGGALPATGGGEGGQRSQPAAMPTPPRGDSPTACQLDDGARVRVPELPPNARSWCGWENGVSRCRRVVLRPRAPTAPAAPAPPPRSPGAAPPPSATARTACAPAAGPGAPP